MCVCQQFKARLVKARQDKTRQDKTGQGSAMIVDVRVDEGVS